MDRIRTQSESWQKLITLPNMLYVACLFFAKRILATGEQHPITYEAYDACDTDDTYDNSRAP